MFWLQSLDAGLFRFINQSLSNPLFDEVMPWLSGNALFFPLLFLAGIALVWRWRGRGLVCVAAIALAVGLGDGVVARNLKHAVGRERPYVSMPEARVLSGKGDPNASLPSAHTVNWFAGTMVLFLFHRRSVRVMLPLALLVGFSRVYNGAHYPGDVLIGAVLGAGTGAAVVVLLNVAWGWVGKKWFPLWWEQSPSMLWAEDRGQRTEGRSQKPEAEEWIASRRHCATTEVETHWVRAGCLLIGALTLFRWIYLASGAIELSEDEAYQWLWSKHLALSYFSKPPLIAWTQFLGTSLWGDTTLGVRFFSPLLAGVMGVWLLRFFAREVSGRAGFFLVLIVSTTPLLSVGALLLTVDPLSVFFWTAAMLSGWRAIQENSRTADWLWVGLWMGLGFLSKYTALFQLLCWVVFFAMWPPARRQLRRAGPYLALAVNALCLLPVIIWNAQRGWPTVEHVLTSNAKIGEPWTPTLKYLGEFVASEFGLLNPVFFSAIVVAAFAFWRVRKKNPLLVYFFSMGAPVFLVYLGWSFHSRIHPNWIAPAILPLFGFMVIYWHARWREGVVAVRRWLVAGICLGVPVVVLLHDTNLAGKMMGRPLPARVDPLRRVRAWSDLATAANNARTKLLAEGKPVFLIGDHYGITGLMSFYLPEARERVAGDPLVFCISSDKPENQFFFWSGYANRKGQNAIYVIEADEAQPASARLTQEFETVTSLGLREITYRGRVLHTIQLFECRKLR